MKNLTDTQTSVPSRKHTAVRWAMMTAAAVVIAGTAIAAVAANVKGTLVGRVAATPLGGSQAQLSFDLTGNLSHLGRSSAHFESIADFAVTPPLPVSTSVGVLTAANGDKMFFTQRWAVQPLGPGVYSVASSLQAVGGTGRFAGASGVGEYRGSVNLNNGTAAAEITGGLIR